MRKESDSMGEMSVPDDALYGASTQRAVLNFPISGHRMPSAFIRALALLKYAAARVNLDLRRLSPELADLICQGAQEIMDGKLLEQFPLDVFQTGSGTSTNMNMNEVISNYVCRQAGNPVGSKRPIHPNDHVNMGQSSNDMIPSALHLSLCVELKKRLIPALRKLQTSLQKKSAEFGEIVKIGRTHLMDATPLTLGQEFSGYAAQVGKAALRLEQLIPGLSELAIGGTAVGTGINCHPEFPARVCKILTERTGIEFVEAKNHFEQQGGRDDAVFLAGALSAAAAAMTKAANDIRLLGSGPRAGFFEINLPATQPGSSIMPGKVNPVMSEMVVQACSYTMGLSQTVAIAGRDGHFELNVNIPLIAYALHESIMVLSNAASTFAERCVDGISANVDRCQELVDRSLMLVTALNPVIGYDKAAWVAKTALKENKSLKQVLLENKLMESDQIDKALDPRNMTSAKE
jgi:fumarate hydratase class II